MLYAATFTTNTVLQWEKLQKIKQKVKKEIKPVTGKL